MEFTFSGGNAKSPNLHECIEDVISLFSNQAEEKKLSLTSIVEPADAPIFFEGDATRIRQILSNLISNSIKFTETGEVSIRVLIDETTSEQPAADARTGTCKVRFLVEDTGVGIAEDKISRLFKPFSQVDSSITRQYGGTGLGLAISKRLIEMMGGSISLESKLGEGSIFDFFIELRRCSQPSQTRPQADLQQKRLLLVDNNEITRQYLRLQSESWNLVVDVADSAESAMVMLFRSEPFDTIAISETIADMESVQLASHIRNFPNYQTIPIILLQTRKKGSAKHLGIFGNKVKVLQKPVKCSHFFNALVEFLLDGVPTSRQNKFPSEAVEISSEDKPLRILLVEDIPLNQKVALHMLSLYGYQADVANNGKEAVKAVKRQPYDLVFMDVQMPEMDGLEATQAIRAQTDIAQPYIVAMTAHAMQGDREECLSVGMNDYIGKPIQKSDLAKAIKSCPDLGEHATEENLDRTLTDCHSLSVV